ncbi:MAG: flagellar hook-length control protein FliK [Methylococcales bacterium]
MITVTTTAQTNTITALASPVVDNTQATQNTTQGTVVAEDFSSALNGQINLATPSAVSAEAVNVALLTTADMTATLANTLATSTETPVLETNASVNPTVMSEKDTAILATVTDTLKFITSGTKLGDTLPAGQSIQLPGVNLSTTLTQQTVQSAVNQAVTLTQVNTPADILAKQITPVQIAIVTTPQTQEATSTALPVLEPINITSQQNVSLNSASTLNSAESATLLQNQDNATTVGLQNQYMAQENSDVQLQTDAARLISQQNNTLTSEPSALQSDSLTFVSQQIATTQGTLSSAITGANVTSQQTQVQQSIVLTQNSTLSVSTQEANLNQLTVAQSTQTALSDAAVAKQTVQNAANNVAQNKQIETSSKVAKAPVLTESAVMNANENVVISSEATVTTLLLVDAQASDSSLGINDQNAQQTAVDATLVPDTLVAMQTVTQQVVAQNIPVEQIESDQTFDKGTDNSSTNERVTILTSAKTLLMDAVANRNNSGDAGNGNKSSNTPQNSSLNNDASLNQSIDNKQNIDAKSFASLLSAEKTDVISVSSADKATPQAVNNVINKLAQDVKSADVAPLTRPLSHPQWNEDLGERIVWMNSRGISSAEIRMNPEHMGPITVRIDMNQDQATIAFTAQNSVVREALEASLPKLREMLSAQQVNLADVSVSQQSSSNSDSGRSAFAQAAADMSNGQGNRQNAPEVDAEGNIIASSTTNETVDEFENGQVISTNGTNGLLSIYA